MTRGKVGIIVIMVAAILGAAVLTHANQPR